MDYKIKNYIVYGVFIALLFLSTLFKSFSTDVLWPQEKIPKGAFDGIVFADPQDISGLNVTRSIVNENNKDLVKYDISFLYKGDFGNLRVLGYPQSQIFLGDKMNPIYSNVTMRGEFDKINNALFQENLKLKDLYKKIKNNDFVAVSKIRIPLDKSVPEVKFTVYYEPNNLTHGFKGVVAKNAVFITNARVESFRDTTKGIKGIKNESKNFQESGYYVNSLEVLNESKLKSISFEGALSSTIFVISLLGSILLIWIDKKKLQVPLLILMMLSIVTCHRFLDRGATTLGILVIWTILSYIASCASYMIANHDLKLKSKELKRSFAFTILFFIFVLIVFIIPRAV